MSKKSKKILAEVIAQLAHAGEECKQKEMRSAFLTINNPDMEGDLKLAESWAATKWCAVGYHEGEEKHVPHYHIAVQFHNSCKFTTIKKRFPRADIQPKLYGDYEQITNYLKKFESVLRHEHGEYDISQQGKRNDIDSWKDDLDAGMDFSDLRTKHWKLYTNGSYSKGLDSTFTWFRPPVIEEIKTTGFTFKKITDYTRTNVILGPPGIGKSEFAKYCLPNAVIITRLEQLLDVRDIQKRGIIFDDFDFRKYSREAQIHLLDNTLPRTLEVRYRNVYIPARTPKIICCNFFPFNRDEAAFMRRICMWETDKMLYKVDTEPNLGACTGTFEPEDSGSA